MATAEDQRRQAAARGGWIDVSRPVSPATPVWPGDRSVEVDTIEIGELTVTSFTTTCHVGTHLDAPLHLDRRGIAAHEVPLGRLIGPAEVIRLPDGCRVAGPKDLPLGWAPNCSKVLLRTDSYPLNAPIDGGFGAIDADLVHWLADRGVETLGVDTPSVDPFDSEDLPAHHALLERGMIWIEGLHLEEVQVGDWELVALPMALRNTEAAPLRVVLRKL